MNTAELDRLLQQTLADGEVQTSERKALTEWAARHADDDQERGVARSRVFDIARQAIPADAAKVVDWLEEMVKVFARPVPTTAASVEPAGAFFSPGTTCIQEVLRQFNLAKKSADVCVFTITDDRITDAIIRAHARGVALRVMTDDEKSHDLGSDAERLWQAGIACKMDVGQLAHMHHKFAIFDGVRLMNGSFNWTRSASEQNEENLIVTADPVLVAKFRERFEQLWLKLR